MTPSDLSPGPCATIREQMSPGPTHTTKLVKEGGTMATAPPRPQTRITLADALRIIRADGQVVEQQPWNMRWCVLFDQYPDIRRKDRDLVEEEIIEYAEKILWDQESRQREA